MEKALILDLDNTIFETRSMNPDLFTPFFKRLAENLQPVFDQTTVNTIMDDLWTNTWDDLVRSYKIPEPLFIDAIKVLDKQELDLNISTYPDYDIIKRISYHKYLVTTSVTSIQQKKIRALNIENDFRKICINNPFKENRTKLDVFSDLVSEFNLIPEKTYVIGDNSESEIAAGKKLNMVTIQVLREGVKKGNNADYYIQSFYELEGIINP